MQQNYKLESSFNAVVLFEISVDVADWSYLIIYGKHINGYYCCIPNHNIGCEMTSPDRLEYNSDKLIDCGMECNIAKSIAVAIKEYSEVLGLDNH